MTEQLRESLSAAMDGEADAFELRRVLDESKGNEELREQWHRYHLLRDVIQGNAQDYDPGLRDAIWAGLQDPEAGLDDVPEVELSLQDATQSTGRATWLPRIAGGAVAAAVAALIMINGGVFDTDQPGSTPQIVQELPTSNPIVQENLRTVATDADLARQNGLMLYHLQQQAMNRAGVASFVKVATFNESNDEVTVEANEDTSATEEAIQDAP